MNDKDKAPHENLRSKELLNGDILNQIIKNIQ